MTNKIAWEPWEDKPITEIPQIEDNTKEKSPFAEEGEPELDFLNFGLGIVPKVRTPYGFFTMDDPMSPLRMFECWVGHANFEITEDIAEDIENISGIGAFRVLSRYRFFIGVEKLFNFREVRQEIQDSIVEPGWKSHVILEDSTDDMYDNIIQHKRWAVVYSVTDGNIVKCLVTNEDIDEQYDMELSTCKRDAQYLIISSEDV